MKIESISLAPRGQKEKSVFRFERADLSRGIIKKGSNELYEGLRRALGGADSGKDVWVEFELDGAHYVLSAVTNAEGVTRRALKVKNSEGKTEVLAREKEFSRSWKGCPHAI